MSLEFAPIFEYIATHIASGWVSIKVLGSGCSNCRKVEEIPRKAVTAPGVEATVELRVLSDTGLAAKPRAGNNGSPPSSILPASSSAPSAAPRDNWYRWKTATPLDT